MQATQPCRDGHGYEGTKSPLERNERVQEPQTQKPACTKIGFPRIERVALPRAQAHGVERAVLRVVRAEPAHQRVAEPSEDLESFRGLQASDDAWRSEGRVESEIIK